MTFEEFKTNVETWAAERGIYEHSTPLAQALKAVSEVGELADAAIIGNVSEVKDAIGDIAVCLINVATMSGSELDLVYIFDDAEVTVNPQMCIANVAYIVGSVARSAANLFGCDSISNAIDGAFFSIYATSIANNLNFSECCESAWNEIKDRKGHMVSGGAFVKEE